MASDGSKATPKNPQAVADTLLAEYSGPDRLNDLPNELKRRNCTFLHAPGDARWDHKEDLKNLHFTCRGLRDFAKEQLFYFMALNFRYEYNAHLEWDGQADLERSAWYVPKLIKMIQEDPALQPSVRALQVSIIPMPSVPIDDDNTLVSCMDAFLPSMVMSEESSEFLGRTEQKRARDLAYMAGGDPSRLDAYGYVDDANVYFPAIRSADDSLGTAAIDAHPDDSFYHLFGRKMFRYSPKFLSYGQQPYAQHVLDSMRLEVIPRLPKLYHVEAGTFPNPADWKDEDYEFISQWGLIFAEALVLKATAPLKRITSLGLRSIGTTSPRMWSEWVKFTLRQTLARVHHFGSTLTSLDLGVEDVSAPLPLPAAAEQRRWPDGVAFWSDMLNQLNGLQNFTFKNSGAQFERLNSTRLCLNDLLANLSLQELRILHLSGWSINTSTFVDRLPVAFPSLTQLGLDMLDLHSPDTNAWPFVLQTIKRKCQPLDITMLKDLRQRPVIGPDCGYVKKLLEEQTEVTEQIKDVWNKLERSEVDSAQE